MDTLLHISAGPHTRGRLSTRGIMLDVLIALLPTTVIGVIVHGWYALALIALSVATAVLTEFLFGLLTRRAHTVKDCSAVVTGLLLALTLPAGVPLYVPVLGAVFAILIVKCLFGGLGHNIMNPALAGRCFLLICFGAAMNNYTLDAVTTATPLAQIVAGEQVDLLALCIGSTSGVIGSSAFGLLAGGIYLVLRKGITLEIPLSMILSTSLFIVLFGGRGLDIPFLLTNILGGGLLMAAIFMATDPVTCPSTTVGQIAFGIFAGILVGLFRVKGSAMDSTTYAILLADLVGPIIDDLLIPTPFGYRIPKDGKKAIPKPVIILLTITVAAGLALSSVFVITKVRIEENDRQAEQASCLRVLPGAETFESEDRIRDTVELLGHAPYGTDFGKVYVDKVLTGKDAQGEIAGHVIRLISYDAYDGDMTMTVGILPDGTVQGVDFTDLHDTPGMGLRCGEDPFISQFTGKQVSGFVLNKSGASDAPEQIDTVTGASITSQAVVNAVNAALDLHENYLR